MPTKRGCVLAPTVLLAAPLAGRPAAAQDEGDEAARAEKAARAEAILAREEGQGRPFDPAFRAAMKTRLSQASADELETVEKRGSGLLSVLAPLDNAHDLVFTPVAPCRVIDTRSTGGPIGAGSQRSFIIAGAGGCGIPFGPATAVVINFVAVAPAGPGDLRAWPYGGVAPTASIMHVTGTTDEIWTAIGTTATDCPPTDFGRSLLVTRIPAGLPTFNSTSGNNLMVQAEPVRVFDVAAGTHTYYLNFVQLNGSGDDDATYRSMEATFYPN